MIARAGFIAFGNTQAWAQVIGNIVVEAIVFVSLLAFRPHKDRKGDWLVSFLSFCRLCAFGLLIAFIPSVGVKPIPRTIIGFVIIVLFGVPTILLLLGFFFNIGESTPFYVADVQATATGGVETPTKLRMVSKSTDSLRRTMTARRNGWT